MAIPPDLLLPHSNWTLPTELPDLSAHDTIAVDLETCDPDLQARGPGWIPGGRGYIVGISYAVDGRAEYFPIDHESGTNLDREKVLAWARRELGREGQVKVFHNAGYDLGWLRRAGIEVRGPVRDTQLLAALLDEGRRARKRYYSLDDLSSDYLGVRKDESLLRDAARVCGLDPKGELWKLPPPFVGPYGESDAALTLALHDRLWVALEDQDLEVPVELESDLIRTSLDMRWHGIRVDVSRATHLVAMMARLEFLARKNVDHASAGLALQDLPTLAELGADPRVFTQPVPPQISYAVDIWSGQALAQLYDRLRLPYPRDECGEPSFDKEALGADPHPVPQAIGVAKRLSRATSYVKTQILGNLRSDDRVHPNWTQLVDDQYGTITGRYSCTAPPMHGVPRRDPLVGPLIRSLFLPEPGERWASCDYSQQEPRLTVHYAGRMRLEGAEAAVKYYQTWDSADYHRLVADMAGISREQAKVVNLGISYGMGRDELGRKLGLEREAVIALWNRYHQELPYIRQLQRAAARRAEVDGYVSTLLGRRVRFDLWERRRPFEEKRWAPEPALPLAEAEKEWPGKPLERAFTYKAISRLIQGSAADQTKRAMLLCREVPGARLLCQIHDELCFSVPDEGPVAALKEAMEGAVSLWVPSKVEAKIGNSWGK